MYIHALYVNKTNLHSVLSRNMLNFKHFLLPFVHCQHKFYRPCVQTMPYLDPLVFFWKSLSMPFSQNQIWISSVPWKCTLYKCNIMNLDYSNTFFERKPSYFLKIQHSVNINLKSRTAKRKWRLHSFSINWI